jgi:UPF0755 protein
VRKVLRWLSIQKKSILIGVGVALVLVLAFAYYVLFFPNYSGDARGTVVTISRGATFRSVVDSLVSARVIRNRWSFNLAGRLLGFTTSIKIGKYLFTSGHSNLDILRDIKAGKSRMIILVTVPEGWRMKQIAHRYMRELGIDTAKFLAFCRDENFIREQGIDAKSLEGYLMPETYSFYWQTEEKEILERMLEGFKRFYSDSLIARQEELGKTQQEILTLASIVEAESNLDDERSVIAGVYWNRLKKGMRLGADPTVQYALGSERRLRFADLDINSPYNTYKYLGLPPGPINSPGKASILATLYPDQNNYLYFVATGVGGHRFAKSYSEHQKNIIRYHRARRLLRQMANKGG